MEGILIHNSIRSNNFAKGSAGMPFHPSNTVNCKNLWQLISSAAQNNEDFQIDEAFTVSFTKVNIIQGLRKKEK